MSDKDQYIEKARAKLAQWDAEIDKMQAKADEAEADARIEYRKRLDELRDRRNEAEAKLKDVADAGDRAWDDVKQGFEKAWKDLSDAYEGAVSRFR